MVWMLCLAMFGGGGAMWLPQACLASANSIFQDDSAVGQAAEAELSDESTTVDPPQTAVQPAVIDDPAADAPAAADDWMAGVDAFFGTYVVAPMETVLFFDFFTERLIGTRVPFIVVWLAAGAIFFTIYMGFINIRGFFHAIRLTMGKYDNKADAGEVSHFQALTSALSATVGLGNMGGVAIAIATGGPGATFWIILVGLFSMTSKFVECTLGQMYRETDAAGHVSGGPMRYLKTGLSNMGFARLGLVLSVVFSILCIGASLGGGNAFQISQSLGLLKSEIPALDKLPWIYGLSMAFLVGLVVVGGIRWIGRVTAVIVPFMCAGYVLMALFILALNIGDVPMAMKRIIWEAFAPQAMYGGFLGVLVIGIRRAVFSNEAGAGSAAIAHSAAKTQIPVREGYVALLEPFIDTVVVCTITALVIVITGVAEDPTNRALVDSNAGAALTMVAVKGTGIELFRWFLIGAVCLFAYSTCITWFYYGERCFTGLFGLRSSILFKILFLSFTFLASIITADNVLEFSDMLILGMAFPNMLGMYFLCSKVKKHLKSYEQDLALGKYQPNS